MGRQSIVLFVALITLPLVGCGPSSTELREQTLSTLNQIADTWDGGKDFKANAVDSYGRPLLCTVEKTTLNYVLEVRSSGPDGLPKNSDDIVVTRSKRHGESSITKEAEKAAEAVSRGAGSGLIEGIKKGLTKPREEKK